jgi:hypothetical protein
MRIITIIFSYLLSSHALSATYEQDVTINSIRPVSSTESVAGYTRVYVSGANWGTCSTGSVDLPASETHILSVLLTAWTTEKLTKFTVDDSLPRGVGSVCKLVNIKIF